MKHVVAVVYRTIVFVGLVSAMWPEGFCADEARVSVNAHQVRYVSGQTVYVEELLGDRWVDRSWGRDGETNLDMGWDQDAFEMRIKTEPQTEEAGRSLSNGWRWISASELPQSGRDAKHFV